MSSSQQDDWDDFESTPRGHPAFTNHNDSSPIRKKGKVYSFVSKMLNQNSNKSASDAGPSAFNLSQDSSAAFSQFSQDFTDRMGALQCGDVSNLSQDVVSRGSASQPFPGSIQHEKTCTGNGTLYKAKTTKYLSSSANCGGDTDYISSESSKDQHSNGQEKEINIPMPIKNAFIHDANTHNELYVRYLSYCFGHPRPLQKAWISPFKERPRFLMEFEELFVLGEGTFSSVSCVRHRLDGTLYAVKKLKKQITSVSQGNLAIREVNALTALRNCPHVVHYHSSWLESHYLYIQTELAHLGTLEDLIRPNPSASSVMNYPLRVDLHQRRLGNVRSESLESLRSGQPSTSLQDSGAAAAHFDHSNGRNTDGNISSSTGIGIREEVAWLILHDMAESFEYMHRRGIAHLDIRPANMFMRYAAAEMQGLESDQIDPPILDSKRTSVASSTVLRGGGHHPYNPLQHLLSRNNSIESNKSQGRPYNPLQHLLSRSNSIESSAGNSNRSQPDWCPPPQGRLNRTTREGGGGGGAGRGAEGGRDRRDQSLFISTDISMKSGKRPASLAVAAGSDADGEMNTHNRSGNSSGEWDIDVEDLLTPHPYNSSQQKSFNTFARSCGREVDEDSAGENGKNGGTSTAHIALNIKGMGSSACSSSSSTNNNDNNNNNNNNSDAMTSEGATQVAASIVPLSLPITRPRTYSDDGGFMAYSSHDAGDDDDDDVTLAAQGEEEEANSRLSTSSADTSSTIASSGGKRAYHHVSSGEPSRATVHTEPGASLGSNTSTNQGIFANVMNASSSMLGLLSTRSVTTGATTAHSLSLVPPIRSLSYPGPVPAPSPAASTSTASHICGTRTGGSQPSPLQLPSAANHHAAGGTAHVHQRASGAASSIGIPHYHSSQQQQQQHMAKANRGNHRTVDLPELDGVTASTIRSRVEDLLVERKYEIRLGDFGLAVSTTHQGVINEGESRYCAPELIDNEDLLLTGISAGIAPIDILPKCDIYSLGASVLELCLGRTLGSHGEVGLREWHALRDDPTTCAQYVRVILQQQSQQQSQKVEDSSTPACDGGVLRKGIQAGGPYSEQLCAVLVDMLSPSPENRPRAADLLARIKTEGPLSLFSRKTSWSTEETNTAAAVKTEADDQSAYAHTHGCDKENMAQLSVSHSKRRRRSSSNTGTAAAASSSLLVTASPDRGSASTITAAPMHYGRSPSAASNHSMEVLSVLKERDLEIAQLKQEIQELRRTRRVDI